MTPDGPRRPWPVWLRVLVVLGVVAALIIPFYVWRAELLRAFADRDQVAAAIRDAGAWGPGVIIGLSIAQTVIAPIPGQIVNFVAGYVYGTWLGLLYSWIGMICGTAIAMLLGRYAGRPLIERLVSADLLERFDKLAAGKGLGFFLLILLIPGLPHDMICFVIGFTTLPLRIMLPAAALVRLPGLIGAVWLGASAERLSPAVWIVVGVLGLAAVLLFWRYGDRAQDFLLRKVGGHEQHS
jgi:uncharacterized membrane protein YdjX (TVP38/TMEM64 family)